MVNLHGGATMVLLGGDLLGLALSFLLIGNITHIFGENSHETVNHKE